MEPFVGLYFRTRPKSPDPEPHKTALVLEDDPAMQRLIWRCLEQLGADIFVEFSKDVVSAIEILKQKTFDIVIADIMLKGEETGLDFWKYCKEHNKKFPFVFISGAPKEILKKAFASYGLDLNAGKLISKPVDIQNLRTAISGGLVQ